MTPEQAKREQRAVIAATDKILKAAGPICNGDVPRAIMAFLVAASSLGRTQDMTRNQGVS